MLKILLMTYKMNKKESYMCTLKIWKRAFFVFNFLIVRDTSFNKSLNSADFQKDLHSKKIFILNIIPSSLHTV